MESTVNIQFKLKGICPILFDRFHGLPQPKSDDAWQKQAIEKLYLNEKNEICIPANAIKKCLVLSCYDLATKKDAKNKVATDVRVGLFFDEDLISIHRTKEQIDSIQSDIAKRPGSKGGVWVRIAIFRPRINEWSIESTMIIYLDMLDPLTVKNGLTYGGIRRGLLGYRPEYGRFIVEKFEVIK